MVSPANVTVGMISKFSVGIGCNWNVNRPPQYGRRTGPCMHGVRIYLSDGRMEHTWLNNFEIHALIKTLPKDNVEMFPMPKGHFERKSLIDRLCSCNSVEVESINDILKRLFPPKKEEAERSNVFFFPSPIEKKLENIIGSFKTKKEMHTRYLRWAMGNHPDKKVQGPESDDADARFREVKKLYDAVEKEKGWEKD